MVDERPETLIFEVDGRRYGLPVGEVVELVRAVAAVTLPMAPGWVEGVVNVRGRVVPVIDLRARLGLPGKPIALSDQLVVARGREFPVALRIDRALVLERLGDGSGRVVKLSDGLAPVLDLDGFLSDDEWAELGRALFNSMNDLVDADHGGAA